ncbi:HDOD domain-containing protein [Massilia sp. X63]|uniref:HDOD domain-containing protein n=1 Tax=Massilia sp. X63 TaxID=3237285 RepID=UPI0034DD7088
MSAADTSRLDSAGILGGVDDLPSLPAVVMELLGSIDEDDIDLGMLAKKVANDPALTAKTLRLANSSAFGLQVKATTIQQAMTFLGFQATRKLITAAALTGCFPSGRCPGFNDKAFWRHSIATAACARALARRVRFNADYAFTAGLLHDIGRLVLVARFPERYQAVLSLRDKNDGELIDAERALLGMDHVDAGVALAEHWHFSDTMRQAIAFHHTPEAPGAGFLATIVHVASAVVHALDLAGNPDELVPRVSAVAWTALGLTEEAWLQVFHETELQYEEMSAILMA